MGFDLSSYATVEERLALFWSANPEGRVWTELVRMDDHACLFRAEVYRHRDDPIPTATGYAYEEKTERGVNATSHVENCETSALGRALANWTFQAGKRPSREEMGKVERMGSAPAPQRRATNNTGSGWTPTDRQVNFMRALGHAGPVPTTKDTFDRLITRLQEEKKSGKPAEEPY